ncbi:MAG: SDR family NAD(P)-dependent oxidoreductase [Lacipirellulaceae bacterium]
MNGTPRTMPPAAGPQAGPRHALVTGGSSGLGLAIARAWRKAGGGLTLVARGAERLAEAAAGLQALDPACDAPIDTISADVAAPGAASDAVLATIARHGRLDLVCHAAGASTRGTIRDTPLADFERLLALNFLAAVELAQSSADALCAARGSLVLVGSLATRVAPAYLGAYPASKHPLAALAQQLRLELGPQGMHTLLVCPGPLERDDAGSRYDSEAAGLPDQARRPGGGARVKAIDCDGLAERILASCADRRAELVVPRRARLLFAISALFPGWGDQLLRKQMGQDEGPRRG